MKYISNECFVEEGIWRLKESASFQYNDGDKAEEHILAAVMMAGDVSSESTELESYIEDWPSKYHLSRERSFAYRSLLVSSNMNVLEIGSGCGAITRYLGETGAQVLALEGSPRRAKITRERTRELENVTVLASPFDLVDFAVSFDLVICNGVLEYAPIFIDSSTPFEDFLRRCKSALSDSGALIVAIENQYGLRYFSSGKEEHTNVLYDGLHGYAARQSSARTFPRKVLKELLEGTIGDVDVLLPIPDYKLPRALLKEELIDYVNLGELVADLQAYDFGSAVKPRLHERLIFHELGKSNLLTELANSFFMVAGPGRKKLQERDWMGSIYKDPKLHQSIKRTDIYLDGESRVRIISGGEVGAHSSAVPTTFTKEARTEDWVSGVSVHTLIARAFCRRTKGGLRADIQDTLQAWWGAVAFVDTVKGRSVAKEHVDAIWRNAKRVGREVELFDQEWRSAQSVPSAWLIYRAVSQFFETEFFYFQHWNWRYRWYSPMLVMVLVGRIVGHRFRVRDLYVSISREIRFQAQVSGKELRRITMLTAAVSPLYVRELKWRAHSLLLRIRAKASSAFSGS